jgi:hypothetical protein
MGRRGPMGLKRWAMPGSEEFREMCFGPRPWDQSRFRRIRHNWRKGGGQAVMSKWDMPGYRPLAFWLCDVIPTEIRRAERNSRCESEAVLFLDLADAVERKRIREEHVIESEIKWHRERRKKYPVDYAGWRFTGTWE